MSEAGWVALGGQVPAGGKLLVATPLLGDPHFSRTVIYLLEHDGGGTVGVIVNRPSHTPVAQVLPEWHDVVSGPSVVFGGGPVQPDGALCLGRLSGASLPVGSVEGSDGGEGEGGAAGKGGAEEGGGLGVRRVVDSVCTVDLDSDVARIQSITSSLRVFAGHAGWSAGQLEDELAEGAWWVLDGTADDLFSDDPRPLWSRVLRRQPYPLNLVSTYPTDPLLN